MEEAPAMPKMPEFPAYSIDPVESAITNAAQAAADAEGMTLLILQHQLKKLCDMQLENLKQSRATKSN